MLVRVWTFNTVTYTHCVIVYYIVTCCVAVVLMIYVIQDTECDVKNCTGRTRLKFFGTTIFVNCHRFRYVYGMYRMRSFFLVSRDLSFGLYNIHKTQQV